MEPDSDHFPICALRQLVVVVPAEKSTFVLSTVSPYAPEFREAWLADIRQLDDADSTTSGEQRYDSLSSVRESDVLVLDMNALLDPPAFGAARLEPFFLAVTLLTGSRPRLRRSVWWWMPLSAVS